MGDTVNMLTQILYDTRRELADAEDQINRLMLEVTDAKRAAASKVMADKHHVIAKAITSRPKGRIEAIKMHREICRSGLVEAKEAIDVFWPASEVS